MSTTRKYNQWSADSPLCRVPDHLRSRCRKETCLGSAKCPIWKLCGPATPFGGYGAQMLGIPAQTGSPRKSVAPCVPA